MVWGPNIKTLGVRFLRRLATWAWDVLIALDVLGNALTFGKKHEPISKRAARARDKGRLWGCVLCKFLDWVDDDHCDEAKNWDPVPDEETA